MTMSVCNYFIWTVVEIFIVKMLTGKTKGYKNSYLSGKEKKVSM